MVDLGFSVSLHDVVALWAGVAPGGRGTQVHQPVRGGVYPVTPRLGGEDERPVPADRRVLRLDTVVMGGWGGLEIRSTSTHTEGVLSYLERQGELAPLLIDPAALMDEP